MKVAAVLLAVAATVDVTDARMNEFVDLATVKNDYKLPLPHEYIDKKDLPASWDWHSVKGTSYVTKSLNQHIPQYCGSCWAHGAMSSLADRIKIARKAQGDDINLAIQEILNCGGEQAGSCHGGSAVGAFQFVKQQGFIPYDTCQPYLACSSESDAGFCKAAADRTTCTAQNKCATCSTFAPAGHCGPIDAPAIPNATIAEYGQLPNDADKIAAEIYARGPIACGINAAPILNYTGGVADMPSEDKGVDHIISITGWGTDKKTGKQFWNIRNSWGQYWGELGYIRLVKGSNQLGIESQCSWATPGTWTEHNTPCFEGGENCQGKAMVYKAEYTDPAHSLGKTLPALEIM